MPFFTDQAATVRCSYCHGNNFQHSKGYCNRTAIDAWSDPGISKAQTSQRSGLVTQCRHSRTFNFSPHDSVKVVPATILVLLWGAALHMSEEQDRGRWGQGVEADGGHTQTHGNCLLIQPELSLQWGFETRHGGSGDSLQRAGSAAGTGTQWENC